MVFLEAWACKKPVIGANIGAVASVISDKIDGLLMQPADATDLSNKILLLANDKSMRLKMGGEGFKKVEQNYTWDIVLKKYRMACIKAIDTFKTSQSSIVNSKT